MRGRGGQGTLGEFKSLERQWVCLGTGRIKRRAGGLVSIVACLWAFCWVILSSLPLPGIPLTKLVESECDKLLLLTDELDKRIIGQEEAMAAVAEAIHRSAGMKDPNGPIANFLFLGPTGEGGGGGRSASCSWGPPIQPTLQYNPPLNAPPFPPPPGVGKASELAKASYLFNSEEAMVSGASSRGNTGNYCRTTSKCTGASSAALPSLTSHLFLGWARAHGIEQCTAVLPCCQLCTAICYTLPPPSYPCRCGWT